MGDPSSKMIAAANGSTNSNAPHDTRARRVGKWEWERAVLASGLKPHTRLFLLVLSHHMDRDGGSCFPAVETIAEEMGVSDAAVYRAKRAAAKAAYVVENKGGGPGRPTHYFAAVPMGVSSDSDTRRDEEETVSPAKPTVSAVTEIPVSSDPLPDQEQTKEQTMSDVTDEEMEQVVAMVARTLPLTDLPDAEQERQRQARAIVEGRRDHWVSEWRRSTMPADIDLYDRLVPNLPPALRKMLNDEGDKGRAILRRTMQDHDLTPASLARFVLDRDWDWVSKSLARAIASKVAKEGQPA